VMISKFKGTFKGTLENGIKVTINDVLYFPELQCNLLSISKMSSLGIDVNFKNGKCVGSKNGKRLFNVTRSDGLYSIQINPMQNQVNTVTSEPESLMDWHVKMGHRDMNVIKRLLINSNVEFKKTNEVCESCLRGKQVKEPIAKHSNRKKTP